MTGASHPAFPTVAQSWLSRALKSSRARARLAAAIAGGLAFLQAERLGLVTAMGLRRLLDLEDGWLVFLAMFASGALATTRARALPWMVSGGILAMYLIVAWTPAAVSLVQGWVEREPPAKADAIVVLSSDVTDEGVMSSNGLVRYVAALELARAGWAPLLIRTDLSPLRPDDSSDARTLAAGVDVEHARVGPVASTRDEAVATARFAREKGIRRVIVVTQPFHERRAAAAFRAVGLEVIACPAPERRYSLATLTRAEERVEAFRDFVTEVAAWTLYSLRGWVHEPEQRP